MSGPDAGDVARLKRYAIQIAAQLPDIEQEAIMVLEYARELVVWEADTGRPTKLKLIG